MLSDPTPVRDQSHPSLLIICVYAVSENTSLQLNDMPENYIEPAAVLHGNNPRSTIDCRFKIGTGQIADQAWSRFKNSCWKDSLQQTYGTLSWHTMHIIKVVTVCKA